MSVKFHASFGSSPKTQTSCKRIIIINNNTNNNDNNNNNNNNNNLNNLNIIVRKKY
jgi:hypothetical protein